MEPPVRGPARGAVRGAARTLDAVSADVANTAVRNAATATARRCRRTRIATPRSIRVLLERGDKVRTGMAASGIGRYIDHSALGRRYCSPRVLPTLRSTRMRLLPASSSRRAVAALASAACVLVFTSTAATTAAAATDKVPVTRSVYGKTAPDNAPGQEMYLQQVVIAPGGKLPEHFHEGTQLATIRSGVLTYNIVTGTAVVTRAGGRTVKVKGKGVVTLRKGDTLVEAESLVHYGSNKGKVPVVI